MNDHHGSNKTLRKDQEKGRRRPKQLYLRLSLCVHLLTCEWPVWSPRAPSICHDFNNLVYPPFTSFEVEDKISATSSFNSLQISFSLKNKSSLSNKLSFKFLQQYGIGFNFVHQDTETDNYPFRTIINAQRVHIQPTYNAFGKTNQDFGPRAWKFALHAWRKKKHVRHSYLTLQNLINTCNIQRPLLLPWRTDSERFHVPGKLKIAPNATRVNSAAMNAESSDVS